MTIASVALLLFAVITAAVGQVMLKHGMQIATARATHDGGSLALRAATRRGCCSDWSFSASPR